MRTISVEKKNRVSRSIFWVVAVLLALLLIGVVRCWWSARSGSEEFATSVHTLKQATIGTFIDCRTPAEAYPDDQLEFWQAEIDRILKLHPDDAELYAAAAVVAYSPAMGYVAEVSGNLASKYGNSWSLQQQVFAGMNAAREQYDAVGLALSRDLIRKATELAPDNPRWWRIRAVLLWPSPLSSESEPVVQDWSLVLNEARRHDPGNALYDLLAAERYSVDAIDFDANNGVVPGDAKAWSKAVASARMAAGSEILVLGEPANAGLVRLHALSRHPTATTTASMRARFIGTQLVSPTLQLGRNLLLMEEALRATSETEQRRELISLAEQINELAISSDIICRYHGSIGWQRQYLWSARNDLEQSIGAPSETTTNGLRSANLWYSSLNKIARVWKRELESTDGQVAGTVSAIALPLFAACLAAALVLALPFAVRRRSMPDLRIAISPVVLLSLAVGISIFFMGIGPAGVASETVQHWVLTTFALIATVALLGGIAARTKLRARFSIRSLLIASAVIAVILQIAFQHQIGWSSLGLPIAVHAESNPLLNMAQQQNASQFDQYLPGPAWVGQSVLQWLMHDGPRWSVAIFLGIAFIALIWRKRVAESLAELLVACALLVLISLNAWVWIEPQNYLAARPTQMSYEAYIRSPEEYYQRIEELMEQELAARQEDAESESILAAERRE